MVSLDDRFWCRAVEAVDYAFQPIVNVFSGDCYGYEALLRGWDRAGFDSIQSFFDAASDSHVLNPVDLLLREKAIAKFARIACPQLNLFFNLDNRVLGDGDHMSEATARMAAEHGIERDRICFEISEKHEIAPGDQIAEMLEAYQRRDFRIAVDDFGAGFSGLKLLYLVEPNFLKIDRFFIRQIAADDKKRLFVSSIVHIAHILGSLVIAEGVESAEEYIACRDIGCDLLQGFLVARPSVEIGDLRRRYPIVETLNAKERRGRVNDDQPRIATHMTRPDPQRHDVTVLQICQAFKESRDVDFFPVVNANDEPLGIVRESDLKPYTYSRYGQELLQNPAYGGNIARFVHRVPIADIHTPVEKILDIYSQNNAIEGILIVEGMRYRGFLNPPSLLRVIHEKNLTAARDQNPLSRLPGNTLIYEYVTAALNDEVHPYYLVYFDFDNFKPFNDHYGFRQGDRIILLFAEMLRTLAQETGGMAGHIGGDDFFLGLRAEAPLDKAIDRIAALTARFSRDAESFYDTETRRCGSLEAVDRDGCKRRLPLLRVSAVLLWLAAGRRELYSSEEMGRLMAILKKKAKQSVEGLCLGVLLNPGAGGSGQHEALCKASSHLDPSLVWVVDSPSLELRPAA